MAAAIKAKYGLTANLKEGHNGIFEVTFDDRVVYSNKSECGRLPEHGDIFQLINEYTGMAPEGSAITSPGEQKIPTHTKAATSSCGCAPEPNKSESAGGTSCCSASSTGGNSRIKTFIFSFVVVLAVGVGGYSIYKRPTTDSQDPETQVTTSTSKYVAGLVTHSWIAEGGAAATLDLKFESVAEVEQAGADKEVLFVLLPGESGLPAPDFIGELEATVDKLITKGKKVAAFMLHEKAEGYDKLVKDFEVESFPSVIVAGNIGQSSVLAGDVTETTLLRAFVLATTPAASCGDNAKVACGGKANADCCPKK